MRSLRQQLVHTGEQQTDAQDVTSAIKAAWLIQRAAKTLWRLWSINRQNKPCDTQHHITSRATECWSQ